MLYTLNTICIKTKQQQQQQFLLFPKQKSKCLLPLFRSTSCYFHHSYHDYRLVIFFYVFPQVILSVFCFIFELQCLHNFKIFYINNCTCDTRIRFSRITNIVVKEVCVLIVWICAFLQQQQKTILLVIQQYTDYCHYVQSIYLIFFNVS